MKSSSRAHPFHLIFISISHFDVLMYAFYIYISSSMHLFALSSLSLFFVSPPHNPQTNITTPNNIHQTFQHQLALYPLLVNDGHTTSHSRTHNHHDRGGLPAPHKKKINLGFFFFFQFSSILFLLSQPFNPLLTQYPTERPGGGFFLFFFHNSSL